MKMNVIIAIVIFFNLGTIIKANEKNASVELNRDLEIYNDYLLMDKQFKRLIDRAVKSLLPYALEVSQNVNITSSCRDNLFQLMNGIRKLTEWSIYYLDAIGKPQSGIFAGNLQMYGEYRQCFETVVKKKDKIEFRGQYCAVSFKPVVPNTDIIHATLQFKSLTELTHNSSGLLKMIVERLGAFHVMEPKIGLCVPSGCTKDDISQLFNYFTEKAKYINATVAYCLQKEDLSNYWIGERIAAVCVLAFLGIVLLTSTAFDNFIEEKKKDKFGLVTKILHCFSLSRNFPKLMNTDTSEGTITCFAGIRVLSLFWILLCHEYMMQGTGLVTNHALGITNFLKNFFNQIVLNGFTSTEIFFLLGGFVNCYTRVKIKQSGKSEPSVFTIIIHRLWRIFPTYFITFLIFFVLSSTGPQYYLTQKTQLNFCRKYWWRNVLFINNFFLPLETCLPHSWYIAVDMQLFLLSLITVPVLLRNEKLGIYLHTGIILIANMGCFILWWIQDLPPTPVDTTALNISHLNKAVKSYMNTLLHVASYFIGLLFGYVVATKKQRKFSKETLFLGWLTASFFYLFVLFITYRWHYGIPYTKLESSLYGSLSKSTLVTSVSWMIYCCITGQGGFVNYILSLKMWIPLSRVTYMLYMLSLIVQSYYNANLNFPTDFASVYLIWSYFGNLSISLLLSFALVLAAESPLLALEKVIFRKHIQEKKSSPEIQKEIILNGKKEIILCENPNITTVQV